MDITPELKETCKNKVKEIINEIKIDNEKNDEEIIKILQSSFINNNYSDSDVSSLDTVSINTSPSREYYYSLSSYSSTDKLRSRDFNNNARDSYSDVSSYCEDPKICSKLAKYFLGKCCCIDDE